MSVAAVLSSAAIDIGPRAALHALNRLGYGPRPADVRRVLARGLEKYVDDQLHPGPDAELDTRLRPFSSLGYSIPQVLSIYNADNRAIGPLIDEFQAARLIRAAHGQNQLQEAVNYFGQTAEDMNLILTSAGRIEKRATRIEELEFDGEELPAGNVIPAPVRKLQAGEF
jgi:hypothetical protein